MTPAKRTSLYLTAATMGLAGTAIMIAAEVIDGPDFVKGFAIGILLVSLVLLLLRRMRDEFIEQLWNAGTSWAFVAVVLSFVFAPLLEGIYDGATGGAAVQDVAVIGWVGPLALLAFFAGFHLKWLRASL